MSQVSISAEGAAHNISSSIHNGFSKIKKNVQSNISLLFCLLLAIFIRLLIIYHAHGIIDGDEGQVGIQAIRILHGEHPLYFYGQPYMGSAAAYILAPIFLIAGSSVWTLRAEPILVSLIFVFYTWKLAGALAAGTNLSIKAQRRFKFASALVAAMPPLFDLTLETRVWSGYIETFTLTVLLFYSAIRLTQRWTAKMQGKECTLRWMGIGFIIGFGLWVDPLITLPIIAVAILIFLYCIKILFKALKEKSIERNASLQHIAKNLSLVITAIPAALIGFAPALYWGAHNNWANISYIFQLGTNTPNIPGYPTPFSRVIGIGNNYIQCDVPRVLSGIVPNIPETPYQAIYFLQHPITLTDYLESANLWIMVACLILALLIWVLSFVKRSSPLLLNMRKLIALPLLFIACAACIYCVSSKTQVHMYASCDDNKIGHYATIIIIAIPFIIAMVITLLGECIDRLNYLHISYKDKNSSLHLQFSLVAAVLISMLLVGYIASQGVIDYKSPARLFFRAPSCNIGLTQTDQIIEYMQQENIKNYWSSIWIGNVISFKTHGTTSYIDPRIFSIGINRIPAYTKAVLMDPRPSAIFFVSKDDQHPALEAMLDKEKVQYKAARFPEDPSSDIIVITPMHAALTSSEITSALPPHSGC